MTDEITRLHSSLKPDGTVAVGIGDNGKPVMIVALTREELLRLLRGDGEVFTIVVGDPFQSVLLLVGSQTREIAVKQVRWLADSIFGVNRAAQ